MPTLETSGTQTATIGTEHTLATITTVKVRLLLVDTAAMLNSDVLELRVNTTVLSGGVSRLVFSGSYSDVQATPQKMSLLLPSDISVVFTLKQTAGTGRAFPWKVLSFGTPVLEASGTQTATIGTEHTLTTLTANKNYAVVIDTGAMLNTDTLELRGNTTVLSAGTSRTLYYGTYRDIQLVPQKMMNPIPSDISMVLTLKQTAGTGRAFPWKVLSI